MNVNELSCKKNNNNRILVIGQVIDAPKTKFVSYLSTGNEVDWAGSEGSLVTRRVPDELFVMWFLLGRRRLGVWRSSIRNVCDSDDIMIHICIYITLWCVFFSFPSSCSRVVERREGASDIGKRKHSAFTKQKGNGKKDKTKTKKKSVDGECSNESRVMLMLSFLAVVSFLQR